MPPTQALLRTDDRYGPKRPGSTIGAAGSEVLVIRVVWLCRRCSLPVSLMVPTSSTSHGTRVHLAPAIYVHLRQHQ